VSAISPPDSACGEQLRRDLTQRGLWQ